MSGLGEVRTGDAATLRHRLGPPGTGYSAQTSFGRYPAYLGKATHPYRRDSYYIAHSRRQSAKSGNSTRLPVASTPIWAGMGSVPRQPRDNFIADREQISIAGDLGSSRAALISFARSGTPAANPLARTFSLKISCASQTFPAHRSEPAANHVNATFTIGSTGHASSFPRTS